MVSLYNTALWKTDFRRSAAGREGTLLSKTVKQRWLWAAALLALAAFAVAMAWLHYQQLCSPGGGNDPYTSDLGQHLAFAQRGMVYSTTSLLIGPAYALGGRWGIAALLALFHLGAVAVFALGLRPAMPGWSCPARLLTSLVINFAQAVWIPRGGYWYQGTVIGTIYHNTTYIMLAPFALLAVLAFYRAWQGMSGKLDLRIWLVYIILLTLATSFKASLVFAFAPALLLLLIADLVRTRGKNLRQEVIMGCSVLPSIALCLIQANVLFADADSGMKLIFTVDFDRHAMLWGPFNEASVLGLLRSFVFVVAVGLLFGRQAWRNFRYRFSLLVFAVAMAEALFLVESGERLYHANLWWGPFICYWVFLLESVSVWLQGCTAWRSGARGGSLGVRLVLCGTALAWHIVSGICFLVLLMQGRSYNIPIETYHFLFF
ncbi:hypothetical protein SUBVAR_06001 [Subdoligranulum variabile DSM 15176]|uniref:Tat pathway signal sequence domain protein n=1 Tax=Subdoligranulum variabile DSM 15176 TaxID=411471 RepID=D1PNT0_9FIRM|nr:hypothetical protein SUBVAR_06001 [Subdoligranulum variabile DSM 15176]